MPGRARGRARGRKRGEEEVARRPGEAPQQEVPVTPPPQPSAVRLPGDPPVSPQGPQQSSAWGRPPPGLSQSHQQPSAWGRPGEPPEPNRGHQLPSGRGRPRDPPGFSQSDQQPSSAWGRPGEPPEPDRGHQLPCGRGRPRGPPGLRHPAHQDVPVEQMARLDFGAGAGRGQMMQSQGYGGARPKEYPSNQQQGIPLGRGQSVDRRQESRESSNQGAGREVLYERGRISEETGRDQGRRDDYKPGTGEKVGVATADEGGACASRGANQEVIYEQNPPRSGEREQRRQPRQDPMSIVTVPEGQNSWGKKPGVVGTPLMLKTNYFSFNFPGNQVLYQYHVDFNPPCEAKSVRLALLYVHENLIGRVHAFDGAMLFIPRRLANDVTEVYSTRTTDDTKVRVTITLTNELEPNNPRTIQVFNIFFRKMLSKLGMTQVQRHYFDFNQRVTVAQHGLALIPGVETAINHYQTQVLLNVEVTHKVIRTHTALDVIVEARERRRNVQDQNDDILRKLLGCIVLTGYNNKTYRVDDIDFDLRVTDTFRLSNGDEITYEIYFSQHYGVKITNRLQPLLVSRPSERRGGNRDPIYLVPEFCFLTGLSDEMRTDFGLMRDMAVHTRVPPAGRVMKLEAFRARLDKDEEVRSLMRDSQFHMSNNLLQIKGRELNGEKIRFGGGVDLTPGQADWSQLMKDKKLLVTVKLQNWILVFPNRCRPQVENFLSAINNVGQPLNMQFAEPTRVEMLNDRNEMYIRALKENVNSSTQMVVCVLSNNRKDRYDAIKKFCICERPVSSQVILAKTLGRRDLLSVTTKIAIQLNCKLGGEAWSVKIPLKSVMVVGIDTYHDSSVRNGSVAGIVCSIDRNCTRYYSSARFQTSHVELVNGLKTALTAALWKYREVNEELPKLIVVYRDGVGDGQLDGVLSHELPQITSTFRDCYDGVTEPALTFVVVKKRINTRFFRPGRGRHVDNPPPGTVVDTDVTNRNWFDFFLVSQSVRQGTVSPTHYNIIKDTSTLSPDQQQILAYKMTHLYYNWPGTIRVPACCHYAHRLAFLCGQSLHREPSLHLADKLFYL